MELLRTENYCLGPLRKPTPHIFILSKTSIINRKITKQQKKLPLMPEPNETHE